MSVFLLVASIAVLAGAIFDGISTVHALNNGGEEQNPIFGKHPSTPRIFIQGGLIIGGEIGVSWLLYTINPVAGVIAGVVISIQFVIHIVFGIKNFQVKAC